MLGKRGGNSVSLYSIRYAQHGDALIRVAHDEVLRWYMSLDGEKWTSVDDHTLKSALDYAHSCLHRASEKCSEKLEWKLDKSTQAKVLGECPQCTNPSMESDLCLRRGNGILRSPRSPRPASLRPLRLHSYRPCAHPTTRRDNRSSRV